MRLKYTISFILGVIVLLYILSGISAVNSNFINGTSLPPVPKSNMNGFVVGAFNTGYDSNYVYISDTLGFNLWHIYTESESWGGRVYPVGWTPLGAPADTLFADNQGPYISQVQGILNNVGSHNMQALMMRPKIEWLCYGQRSDYQCEQDHIPDDYWFYAFNLHDVTSPYGSDFYDNTIYGSNQWVRYLHGNPINPNSAAGYVVRSLRANAEQCRSGGSFHGDSLCDWYIKPRIRIDSTVAHSASNPLVCKIKVIAQDGSIVLKEVNLRASNFLDENFNYNGRYLEEFYHFSQDTDLVIHGAWGNWPTFSARGYDTSNPHCNQADIQVYWYGNCDMWIDYVRVDNDVADQLFKGYYEQPSRDWLRWEAQDIAASNCAASYNFYIELFEFNNIPCMKYVSRKLDQVVYQSCGKHISVMCMSIPFNYAGHVPWENRLTVQNAGHFKRNFIDSMGVQNFLYGFYPFNSSYHYPETYPYYTWTKVPSSLPDVSYKNGLLSKVVSPTEYDDWLQNYLDSIPYSFEPGFSNTFQRNPVQNDPGGFRYTMQFCDSVSKLTDKPFIYNPQLHIWFCQCNAPDTATSGISGEVQREPTNEELNLTANLALSYGARGLMYFEYRSYNNPGDNFYSRGIVKPDYSPWRINIYGQDKWYTIKEIVNRMKTWSPYIMSFDNTNRHSYIYHSERMSMMTNSYIEDVATYKPGSGIPQNCVEDNPEPGQNPPEGYTYECKPDRYLQVATFQDISTNPKYFMIVNKRCSPYRPEILENGGHRLIKARFYASKLQIYNTWKLINLLDNTEVQFNKIYDPLVDLGEFNPGEGKLFKLIPVPQSGGTLLADENISGDEFTCIGNVYNNGYNITIGSGTTIHFTDSSKIIMNGGTIQLGDPNYNGPANISIGAVSGNHWKGFDFNNCTVKIYNTTFSGINNDTNYAINIIDCPYVDIQKNTFNCSDNYTGAVNLTYYSIPEIQNAYIGGSTINSNSSAIPAFNILSYAGITIPLIAENNTFTSSSALGSTAILLSGITGGAVKNNTITNYEKSINALSSSLDISGNTISSDVSSSKSISGLSGTELKMNNSGDLYLGGMNTIVNTGGSSFNLFVENSYFLLDNGENIFDIKNDLPSYHLKGNFPDMDGINTSAVFNCFKINGTPAPPPVKDVVWGDGTDQVNFTFEPYLTGCSTDGGGDFVIYLGGGINDTITQRSGGGGESNRLPLAPVHRSLGVGGKEEGMMILSPKQLYDSICIQMRFRNYGYVKNRCMDLINTYPDSIQSLNAIAKLYLSSTSSDTSHSGISALKTYYETLILNNTNNTALVNRCNYFVQKCKVRLRQYSSALAGFEQIINNNPYSYEALVAKWDYMATHLLDSLSGGGEVGDGEGPHDKFTKEQRQVITSSIGTAQLDSKIKEEKKIEILSVLANTGNSLAAAELKVKKTLKEVSKPQSPHSIIEHIKIVNNDIQKVFGNPNRKSKNENNLIPTVFRLSQNYPNPFNPITKIQYDLPKDVRVKLIIYDILGREVIRLVNNEFKQAGRYTVEFNGNNYASGVYFYRIEADKFVQSKKMVLVK